MVLNPGYADHTVASCEIVWNRAVLFFFCLGATFGVDADKHTGRRCNQWAKESIRRPTRESHELKDGRGMYVHGVVAGGLGVTRTSVCLADGMLERQRWKRSPTQRLIARQFT